LIHQSREPVSQEDEDNFEVIFSGDIVGVGAILVPTVGIADSCQAINVEDGGISVPRVFILGEVSCVVLNDIRAMLLCIAQEG
jgi:hypothetical protein